MSAPKGNRFWEARSKHGRNPKFETPEQLWEACTEYFAWVEDNPLWETKVAQYQGEPVDMPSPKMRAMTKAGLCIFLDISEVTWDNYRLKQDFIEVTTRAERVMYAQKFSGAAAELLNPNIIARDLGLSDKTSNEHTGKNGGPIETRQRKTVFVPVGNKADADLDSDEI